MIFHDRTQMRRPRRRAFADAPPGGGIFTGSTLLGGVVGLTAGGPVGGAVGAVIGAIAGKLLGAPAPGDQAQPATQPQGKSTIEQLAPVAGALALKYGPEAAAAITSWLGPSAAAAVAPDAAAAFAPEIGATFAPDLAAELAPEAVEAFAPEAAEVAATAAEASVGTVAVTATGVAAVAALFAYNIYNFYDAMWGGHEQPEPQRRASVQNWMGRLYLHPAVRPYMNPPPTLTNADDMVQINTCEDWISHAKPIFDTWLKNTYDLGSLAYRNELRTMLGLPTAAGGSHDEILRNQREF